MAEVKLASHPEFERLRKQWKVYQDLNCGDHDTLAKDSKYLHLHEFETNELKGGTRLRAIREERTEYTNYLRPIVNRYCSLMFRNAVDTKDVESVFGDDIRNVDGQGNSLENFLKTIVAPCFFLYGKAAILTDSYMIEARSRAEEQESGQRPFFELVEPLNLPAWSFLGEGQSFERYRWVRTEAEILEPWTDPTDKPVVRRYSKVYRLDGSGLVVDIYRGPNAAEKVSIDPNWELLDSKPVGIGEIPIACLDKDSWMKDVSRKALQLFNLESSLDNQLNFQGYQRAFAAGAFKEGDSIVMNEAGLVCFPEGTNIQVVEPTNPVALMNRINGVTATLFQIAFYRTRVLPSDAKAIESSDNQRESKEEFLSCIINAATQIEGLANQAIRHYAAFKGMTDFEGEIKIDKDITVEDWDQVIGNISAFYSDIKAHSRWYKSTMKKVATQMNLADIDEIVEEIESVDIQAQEQEKAAAQLKQRGAMFQEAIAAKAEDAEPEQPSNS